MYLVPKLGENFNTEYNKILHKYQFAENVVILTNLSLHFI